MRDRDYRAYIGTACASLPGDKRHVLYSLMEMDMDQRSAVAKLCRAQCNPTRSTRLFKMCRCLPLALFYDIVSFCQDPLLAGFLLHCTLLAPMSTVEIQRTYSLSLQKETDVMNSRMRDCTLNFECFFGQYNIPICDLIPPNAPVARKVRQCIDGWIRSLQKGILFPRLSSKTVSKATAHEVRKIDRDYTPLQEGGISPIDLERVYYLHGVKVQGPCELRQKWYTSNLQPRTYFAQGGDAYHTSKYLAKAFTDLCDTLPSTNRYTRVAPNRIVIREPTADIVFYDLSSFTSNLHVQRTFMYRLAKYCSGATVMILDSVSGPTPVDLGTLILEYTRTNLHDPAYTMSSIHDTPSEVCYHNVAGFLGVYGNIATATFIHGIVMAMQHKYFDENNVAGDDGLDVTETVDVTLSLVQQLGTVKDEKTFRASEGCCIHLKRPITRIENRLHQGQLVVWPALELVTYPHDERYPYLNRMTRRQKRDGLASSISAFLRSLQYLTLDDDSLNFVDTALSYIYRTNSLPTGGCVPQVTRGNLGFVPIYEKRFIGEDPISNTLIRHYNGLAHLPLRRRVDWDPEMINDGEFECNSSNILRHLVALGVLEQEKLSCIVYGKEGLDQLLKEYTHHDPRLYKYTVIDELPLWWSDYVASNSVCRIML